MPQDVITSRDNPLVKRLRALALDAGAYREQGRVWLEGDHLCRALLARARVPDVLVLAQSQQGLADGWGLPQAVQRVVLADRLMAWVSGLSSPAPIACLYQLPLQVSVRPQLPAVVLDRVQDPGNVGSILRSAAAFGYAQVLALKGTAALWSPKVLRAGMGAHFALNLLEGLDELDLSALELPLLATSSHGGELLHRAALPWPCAWLFGHEGQGVSAPLLQRSAQRLRIAQPGGEESLNVAAAAAICLHASATAR